MKELITRLGLPNFGEGNTSYTLDSLGGIALIQQAIADGTCVYKTNISGYRTKDFRFYVEELKKLGLKCNFIDSREHYKSSIFSNDEAIVALDSSGLSFTITLTSLNEALGPKIIKLAKDNSDKPKKQGYVFAIMRQGNGLGLTRMGYAGSPLEEDNYSEKVMEDYRYIIKDLKSSDPSGRIIILDGKPGTGKTYLVRSILNAVEEAMFVIVPPSMVSSLGGPELLPLLVQNRQSYAKTGPTVLILEDADQCLAPRAADNIATISSLLNLGDGIFGSLLDIRIVATTNAKSNEMDEAIMRPGRLSRRLEVDALTYEKANAVYQRLVGKKKLALPTSKGRTLGFNSKEKPAAYTLADVYKKARDAGWEPKTKPAAVDNDEELDHGEAPALAG